MISERSFDFGNLFTLGIYIYFYYFERKVSVTQLKVLDILMKKYISFVLKFKRDITNCLT